MNDLQVRLDVDFNGINHFKMESLHFDTLDDFTNEQYLVSLPEGSLGKSLSSEIYNATLFATDDLVNRNNHSNMAHENIISESFERPAKQIKTNSWNPSPVKQANVISSSSSSQIISFSNVSSQTMDHQESSDYSRDVQLVQPYEDLMDLNATYDNDNYTVIAGKPIRRSNPATVRAPSHVQDHVIAERKRRERLTERFIALSAIVPGLKKVFNKLPFHIFISTSCSIFSDIKDQADSILAITSTTQYIPQESRFLIVTRPCTYFKE